MMSEEQMIDGDTSGLLEEDEDGLQLELQEPLVPTQQSEPSSGSHGSASYVIFASMMAALGGLLFGYDVGIISGALLQLREVFNMTCFQQEMVVSSMLMGALLGSLLGGFLVDHYGRRLSIIINALVFILGAIILALAPNYPVLIVGRILVGFAVSLSAIAECVYISEIAPARRRGLLVSLNELGITLGLLLAYLVNYLFINTENGWRYMFGLSAVAAAIQGIGMIFLPQSPRFLMLKKQEQKARTVLQKLRCSNSVDRELNGMRISIAAEQSHSLFDLFSSADNMRGRMFIGTGIIFFQQFTGQPNVLYYAPTIFLSLGFHNSSAATLATVGLGTVKVISTIVSLLSVDKAGRRKFLIGGALGMMFSILLLAVLTQSLPQDMQVKDCNRNSVIAVNRTSNGSSLIIDFPDDSLKTADQAKLYRRSVNNSSELYHTTQDPDESDSTKKGAGPTTVLPFDLNTDFAVATAKWAALFALMVYVASYAMGFGPVSWLVLSEIFPASIKGRAIAMTTVFNWGTNLVISMTFLNLIKTIGIGWLFTGYAFVCFIATCFIFSFVPETKNRSLEQVSNEMKSSSALKRMVANCQMVPCFKPCETSGNVVISSSDYEQVSEQTSAT
ncbi:unnamed protein product [Owenia fusiformis]|uniref:Uncharacterized protein n=1 Tax=Owenia fusiformis TaxID=6347 RepID=A0A8J1Y001_OWEFU|nr:unnamed protein product [Owenia fusiformis]